MAMEESANREETRRHVEAGWLCRGKLDKWRNAIRMVDMARRR